MDVSVCQIAKGLLANLALFELHFVLSERSGLVRENELNLAKFFNQITVATQSEIHVFRVCKEHLDVIVDYFGLDQL